MALGHVFVVVIGRLQSVKNTLVEVAKDFGVTDVLVLRLAFNPHSCGASRHRFLFYSSWMPPVKRHWKHLEAQRPVMSKKAESAQLDFEGRGAQQIPSCLNMRTRSCRSDDRMFLLRFSLLCPWLKCGGKHSWIRSGQAHAAAVAGMDWLQPKSCWNAVKSYDVGFWEDLGSEIGNRTGKSTSSS